MKRTTFLILLFSAACAHAGVVVTRDGKSYTGPLRLAGTRLGITGQQGTRWFEFSEVLHADFRSALEKPAPGHGLRGEYFVGKTLQRCLLERDDACIDFKWHQTLPSPALCPMGREFSVRWTGQLCPDFSEKYQIITRTDDGVRVWLDGKLIIDRWFDQFATDCSVEVSLEAGRRYDLRVEYYNGPELASAALLWFSPSTPRQVIPSSNLYLPAAGARDHEPPGLTLSAPSADGGPAFKRFIRSDSSGLLAEYFTDRDLTQLHFTRFDAAIDFHFHNDNPPDPGMAPEGSIRWTGMIQPGNTEEYRFHVEAHRRVRMWLGGKVIIDKWTAEGGEFNSEPVKLTAGQKLPIKIEYSSSNGFMLCRLRWSSPSTPRDLVPSSALSGPSGRLARPVVGLVYPASDQFVVAPASVALLAAGLSPNGPVQRVEFFNRGGVIGAVGAQPFRLVWSRPPAGVYSVQARLTDSLGISALSDAHLLTIAGRGDGSLRAPWGDFFMSNNEYAKPGAGSMSGDQVRIASATGTLTADSDNDAGHFVIQPLTGDGQIIAHLASLVPLDPAASATAGITLRQNLKNRCKQVSVLLGGGESESSVSLVRRLDYWMNPVQTERRVEGARWLKLVRHRGRVYAYASSDGQFWELLGAERFDCGPMVMAGLFAGAKDREKPATAQFDHVQVIAGSPVVEGPARGFVTRLGSMVAAEVLGIEQSLLRYRRDGREQSIAAGEVARVLYQPLLTDDAARLRHGNRGLLLASGDFIEGDITALIQDQVAVSSVLFGLRRQSVNEELAAAILHDVQPAPVPYLVSTTDQSIFRARTIASSSAGLEIDEASLGRIAIPLGAVAQIRAQ